MMKTKVMILFSALLIGFFSSAVSADQFYAGAAINPAAGQPKFEVDGFLNGTVAYETEKWGLAGWRFSFSSVNFRNIDSHSMKIGSHILAAETMFVAKLKTGLALIGAIGPALFRTTAMDEDVDDEVTYDIGLSATGSLRFALNDSMFLSVAYHYKNCAVSGDDDYEVVDGGYQAVFLNFGLFL